MPRYGRRLPHWHPDGASVFLTSEQQLHRLTRYVEHNPVVAVLAASAEHRP